MIEDSQLPRGLVWRPDGHVSDWVLSALVDGEASLLPEEAIVHADSCDECTERLAAMAEAAFALGDDLERWGRARASLPVAFPKVAFAAVAMLVVLGALTLGGPEWAALPHKMLTLWRWSKALAPWVSELVGTLALLLACLGVVIAIVIGVAVAKRASPSSTQGSWS